MEPTVAIGASSTPSRAAPGRDAPGRAALGWATPGWATLGRSLFTPLTAPWPMLETP
jgi:hypothetical protein